METVSPEDWQRKTWLRIATLIHPEQAIGEKSDYRQCEGGGGTTSKSRRVKRGELGIEEVSPR